MKGEGGRGKGGSTVCSVGQGLGLKVCRILLDEEV